MVVAITDQVLIKQAIRSNIIAKSQVGEETSESLDSVTTSGELILFKKDVTFFSFSFFCLFPFHFYIVYKAV